MTTDLELPAESVRPFSARARADGQPAAAGPKHRRSPVSNSWAAPEWARTPQGDVLGQMLIAAVCVLLVGLAVAMGVTSFHAQFTYIFATKRQWAPALLEALGLDTGAVIFALLGVSLARMGRRAAVERVLVVVCALGSCGMNVLNANLGSPRSVAVYAMPPVLFALTSDRLISVVRRAALGKAADDETQRSAWYVAGRSLLYGIRFAVDRRGTAAGLRQAILEATPLPRAALSAVLNSDAGAGGASPAAGAGTAALDSTANYSAPGPVTAAELVENDREARRARSRGRNGTKTARFLSLAQDKYGPLAKFDLASVYRVSAELAPKVRLNTGSARAALRAAVLATRDGSR
jgi:hypothetical protein